MNQDDSIIFHCQHCHVPLRAPQKTVGKQTECPKCNKKIIVPADGQTGGASSGKRKS